MPYRIGEELFLEKAVPETEIPIAVVTRQSSGLIKTSGVDTVAKKGSKNLLTSGAAYDIIGQVITLIRDPTSGGGGGPPLIPFASTTIYGIVKIGTGITVVDGVISATSGGTPAGANMQVQFNDSGVFGANAAFTFNKANGRAYVTAIGRTAHNTGYLEGGYNNIGVSTSNTSPIYVVGSSYVPASTTLSGMYGIGFSQGIGASFLSWAGGGWGMYVAASGTAKVFLDGQNGVVSATQSLNLKCPDGVSLLEILIQRTAGTTTEWRLYNPTSSSDLRFRYIASDKFIFSAAGGYSVTALGGAGLRMVTVDNTGLFSAQAIPSGGTPAGATNQIQYNNAGAFGANANFVWDITNSRLGVGTPTPSAKLHVASAFTAGEVEVIVKNSVRIADGGDGRLFLNAAMNSFIFQQGATMTISNNSTGITIGSTGGSGGPISISGTINTQFDLTVDSGANILVNTGVLRRGAHHLGYLQGALDTLGDNSTFSNPIFTIGASYAPAGTTLGTMYGIGFSHANFASFLSALGGGWGMYVASNGVARIHLDADNGLVRSTGGSGTYTPVLTGIFGAAAATVGRFQWSRVNNIITVSGGLNITSSGGGQIISEITIPIPADITTNVQLAGAANSPTAQTMVIFGNPTTDKARLIWTAAGAETADFYLIFSYSLT